MTLHIRDAEAEQLARDLAQRNGTTMTAVVVEALRAQFSRERRKASDADILIEETRAIARHFNSLPIRDSRTDDELLYDEHGLPA